MSALLIWYLVNAPTLRIVQAKAAKATDVRPNISAAIVHSLLIVLTATVKRMHVRLTRSFKFVYEMMGAQVTIVLVMSAQLILLAACVQILPIVIMEIVRVVIVLPITLVACVYLVQIVQTEIAKMEFAPLITLMVNVFTQLIVQAATAKAGYA